MLVKWSIQEYYWCLWSDLYEGNIGGSNMIYEGNIIAVGDLQKGNNGAGEVIYMRAITVSVWNDLNEGNNGVIQALHTVTSAEKKYQK